MNKKEAKEKERREAAAAYVKELLAKVPETVDADKRAAAQEVLEAVLDHVGDGVLRQSDYSRAMDALRDQTKIVEADKAKYDTLYADNVKWRATQEAGVSDLQKKVERYEALFAADPLLGGADPGGANGGSNGSPRPGVDLSSYIKREDAEKLYEERATRLEREGIALMAQLAKIQTRHLKTFDEVLEPQDLIEHATKANLPLDLAYQDFIKERVEESSKKDHEAAIAKAREEGRIEGLRAAGPVLPHSVGNNEPTVLDALSSKDRSEFGLKKALDDYWAGQSPSRQS